jgi:hypothetical protein
MSEGIEKTAMLALTSWGMELFRSSIEDSANVTTTLSADGVYVFAKRNCPDKVTLTLNGNATQCSCRFWKAYHVQCSHLLLLHNGFSEKLFSRRWFQLSELGTTVVHEEACDSAGTCSTSYFEQGNDGKNDGINNDGVAVLGDGTNNDVDAALGEHQALRIMTSGARRLGLCEIRNVTNDLAFCIHNMSNNTEKKHFFGEIVKFLEIAKGNSDVIERLSVPELLEGHLSMYCRSTDGIRFDTQHAELTHGEALPNEMKRAAPLPASNHGKTRKKPFAEIRNDGHRGVMSVKRRVPSCSLCWGIDHRAKGTKCPLTSLHKAQLVAWNDIAEMTSNLGNPDYFVVSHPDMDTKKRINRWFFRDGSGGIVANDIPAGACHLVLLDIYYCATPNQHFCHNLMAVTVLEEGGRPKSGWDNAFFAAHQIADW